MVIIIDAYNILKQISSTVYIQEEQRQKFLGHIDLYAQQAGHQMITVFDGGDTTRPQRSKRGVNTVFYAGSQSTADEVIKKLLDCCRPEDTVLVSSDGQLCFYAEQRGVVSVDSVAFYNILLSPLKKNDRLFMVADKKMPVYKFGPDRPELDIIMEQAVDVMMCKSEDDEEHVPVQRRMLSKKEKKMMKVIKKL